MVLSRDVKHAGQAQHTKWQLNLKDNDSQLTKTFWKRQKCCHTVRLIDFKQWNKYNLGSRLASGMLLDIGRANKKVWNCKKQKDIFLMRPSTFTLDFLIKYFWGWYVCPGYVMLSRVSHAVTCCWYLETIYHQGFICRSWTWSLSYSFNYYCQVIKLANFSSLI